MRFNEGFARKINKMREDIAGGSGHERGRCVGVDARGQGGRSGGCSREGFENGRLAPQPVRDQRREPGLRVGDWCAVPRVEHGPMMRLQTAQRSRSL